MDIDEHHPEHHRHTAHVKIDGEAFDLPHHRTRVAELLALVGKDDGHWDLASELEGGDTVILAGDSEVDLREGHHAAFRTVRREGHHHHRHHHHNEGCEITVVVNSAPVKVEVTPDERLSAVVTEVLGKASAAGRPEDQWELRTEAGAILELSLTVAEAHVECGSTLFLSLKAGAAGEARGELLADPVVCRAKFDEQVAKYRGIQGEMHRRGIWLVKAEYPEAFVVFGTSNSQFPMLAFAAVFDFTNYDLWPPSLKIVHPFTKAPYRECEMPPSGKLFRAQASGQAPGKLPSNQLVLMPPMMQAFEPTEIPFLCLPGVREYHNHPAHTGDSWLQYRGTEVGTLGYLLDILFKHGSSRVTGFVPNQALNLVAR